ncbi:biotin synthase [Pseudomassariella vexata]|uniref:biotin synthase n=1 Tax=Pseudomassariella vexata TaxID=1141098 RepID=A0A1Y2EC28_9PEZI|nr:biotin synthase [Pseudomassariella vexata]ORY69118.1 biotin synthase [Pseudomassariella vexata]
MSSKLLRPVARVGRQGLLNGRILSPRAYGQLRATPSAFQQALHATSPRTDWKREEISEIYNKPLMELAFAAGTVHRRFHNPTAIQMCTLMNIKTGGCSEDCSYCAQSSRYQTGLTATKVSSVESVLAAAKVAKDKGSTRFCMGAAWRDMRGRKSSLKNIKAMVEGVHALGLESCVTLGMLDERQARELKDAGLTAYNHNVDTSREHYPKVISTRSYDERLQTIAHVREAGIKVCTGGILGLGEAPSDHVGLLHTVATMPSHPESFPVNTLVPIEGTPLFRRTKPIEFDAVLRTVAAARLIMPTSIIRIAAGRTSMSEERQVLCFMAGANAVFTGEKMLTTACTGWDQDLAMFKRWGLVPMKAHVEPVLPKGDSAEVRIDQTITNDIQMPQWQELAL